MRTDTGGYPIIDIKERFVTSTLLNAVTGTCTGTSIATDRSHYKVFWVSGAVTANTVVIEGSPDGSNWITDLSVTQAEATSAVVTTPWAFQRARVSAWSSLPITVKMNAMGL